VRGYQKKVIFLKNTGSHLFDEAYFVMSREGESAASGQFDMVLEANKIIDESLGDGLQRGGGKDRGIVSFLLPFLLGIIFSFAIVFAIYYFLR
jgi:hypothetical protein